MYLLTLGTHCRSWRYHSVVLMMLSLLLFVTGQQRYMILHQCKLYIFKDETATRAQKVLPLSNYCK